MTLRFLREPWQRGDRSDYEFMRIALDKALTARKKGRHTGLLEEWKDLLALRERRLELQRDVTVLRMGATRNRTTSRGVRLACMRDIAATRGQRHFAEIVRR